jgi:hypothetical protein
VSLVVQSVGCSGKLFFLPDSVRSNPREFIGGIHEAFLVLGGFTILSTIVFAELKSADGGTVSQPKALEVG